VTCAAGAATVRYLKRHRLVERCAELSVGSLPSSRRSPRTPPSATCAARGPLVGGRDERAEIGTRLRRALAVTAMAPPADGRAWSATISAQ
jgi:hypothetical protein